ncbi:MAG: electron transport complex subunit RsxG [Gammaproteobacteria bacterium]|nr:electron transport complex subunit RsxG [Gammaproteobacteria bacterium]
MKTPLQQVLGSALILCLFAVIGTALVALTHKQTRDQIKGNERQELLARLSQVVSQSGWDNDLITSALPVHSPELLGSKAPVPAYRATQDGQPVAVILTATARNGYNGRIQLLVGIQAEGTISGVRVIQHKETPGLGDAIEAEKSDWILGFNGLSLFNLSPSDWAVKKDGGVFDQFTGATITPRAVVGAVYRSLQFFENNQERLLNAETANDQ